MAWLRLDHLSSIRKALQTGQRFRWIGERERCASAQAEQARILLDCRDVEIFIFVVCGWFGDSAGSIRLQYGSAPTACFPLSLIIISLAWVQSPMNLSRSFFLLFFASLNEFLFRSFCFRVLTLSCDMNYIIFKKLSVPNQVKLTSMIGWKIFRVFSAKNHPKSCQTLINHGMCNKHWIISSTCSHSCRPVWCFWQQSFQQWEPSDNSALKLKTSLVQQTQGPFLRDWMVQKLDHDALKLFVKYKLSSPK